VIDHALVDYYRCPEHLVTPWPAISPPMRAIFALARWIALLGEVERGGGGAAG